MPSAFLPSARSYRALPLARQLVLGCVHPGPLVLRTAPLKFPPPMTDRTELSRDVLNPAHVCALTGEQPALRNLLQLQDAMSRHRGAKPERRCELLAQISLLSPYAPSVERWPFHADRITKAWFPTCSSCRTRSQARFCFCTLRLISKQPERTFARLRYSLEATAPVKLPT